MNYSAMIFSLFLTTFNTLAYSTSFSETATPCPNGEEVYFSCETDKSKSVSLCGVRMDDEILSLTYYFGGVINPKLVQTASSANDFEPFRFNHYFRYGVDYFRVSFIENGNRYEVYRDYELEGDPAEQSGIIVAPLDEPDKEINIKCHGKIIAHLSPLSSILKCDKDNALGCAK